MLIFLVLLIPSFGSSSALSCGLLVFSRERARLREELFHHSLGHRLHLHLPSVVFAWQGMGWDGMDETRMDGFVAPVIHCVSPEKKHSHTHTRTQGQAKGYYEYVMLQKYEVYHMVRLTYIYT